MKCSLCEAMALHMCESWNACKSYCFSVFMLVSILRSFNGAVVEVYCTLEKYLNGCVLEQMTSGAIMLTVLNVDTYILYRGKVKMSGSKNQLLLKLGNLKRKIFVLTAGQLINNESQQ